MSAARFNRFKVRRSYKRKVSSMKSGEITQYRAEAKVSQRLTEEWEITQRQNADFTPDYRVLNGFREPLFFIKTLDLKKKKNDPKSQVNVKRDEK